MPRPPHAAALFPYTALFRSDHRTRPPCAVTAIRLLRRPKPSSTVGGRPRGTRDLKSTRLNSSHVEISYAVFCLKKKTTPAYANRHHQASHPPPQPDRPVDMT